MLFVTDDSMFSYAIIWSNLIMLVLIVVTATSYCHYDSTFLLILVRVLIPHPTMNIVVAALVTIVSENNIFAAVAALDSSARLLQKYCSRHDYHEREPKEGPTPSMQYCIWVNCC